MAPAADRLSALSESQRQQLESLLLDFEVAWSPKGLGERVDKLPLGHRDYRHVALLELVKIDLERQWQAGNQCCVEDYLQRFPELGTTESVAAELLLAEYQARQLSGAPAELHGFGRRFPQHIERLQQLLQQSSATASSQVSRAARANTSRAGEKVDTQAEPTAQSWSLPKEFGRYRILKPLGAGGMGSVFLAHDTELDRQVAIKTPKFAGGEDPQLIERFYREARAAARLQNRHICAVYDVGEIDGVRYISMAYIQGRPLSAYIRSDRTQPDRSVVLVVGRLARALQEAHAQGIVHRDLKPSNIMIDSKREPVIMDFGLARDLDRQGDSRLTQSGMVLGTPAYMAPEQVSGESDRIGPPSDIYSLGVILYELLTGRVPFEGSMVAVLGQIMTQRPPPPSEYRADLDPRLEQICLKMISKRVEDRYASMQEVAEALGDFLRGPVDEGLDEEASADVMAAGPAENQQLEEMFATQYARKFSGPLARTERDATQHSTPSAWHWLRRPPVAVGTAAGVLALILFGVLILLRTPHGTLRIEVNDPQLNVSVDADELTIEELKEPQELQVGTHRLAVKLGDTTLPLGDKVRLKTTEYDGEYQLAVTLDDVTAVSESFTIVKGDQRVLAISLEKLAPPEPIGPAAPPAQQASGIATQGQINVTSAQVLNPDRTVTSLMLAIGGSVGVLVGESNPEDAAAKIVQVSPHATFSVPAHYRQITAHADVPQEAFSVHTVVYPSGTRVDDLSHLAGLKELHTIVMEGTQPSERAFTTLPRPNSVRVLVLHDAKIDAANMLGLSGWSTLEHLDLYGVLLRGRRIQDADLAILREFSELGFLNLDYAEITDASIDTLVQCKKLHWLAIAHAKITDEGLGKLRVLRLQALYMGGDQITDAGLAYLTDFHELVALGVGSRRLTDARMRAMADIYDGLESLMLGSMKIADDELTVLEKAARLRALELGPGVTDKGLTYITRCPLQTLDLEKCEITDAGLRQLEQITTLELLILGLRAKVSESALQSFRTKLPACKVLVPPGRNPLTGLPHSTASPSQSGETFANSLGMRFRQIPAGEFVMGSPEGEGQPDEHPQHRVRITKAFYLGQCEVTQGQYEAVMGDRPWSKRQNVKEGSDYAASWVNWNDAVEFCQRLSQKERRTYRLPTEAEWEYACRGGTTSTFHFGGDVSRLGEYAWFKENTVVVGERYAHEVGQKRANPFGLIDMLGNVWEWCSDWCAEDYYAVSPLNDPTGPDSGSSPPFHVARGGGFWATSGSCPSANRAGYPLGARDSNVGFRVALNAAKPLDGGR